MHINPHDSGSEAVSREAGYSTSRRGRVSKSARLGYHDVLFGVEEWKAYQAAADQLGLSVAALMRLLGRNLPNLLPHIKLIPPSK